MITTQLYSNLFKAIIIIVVILIIIPISPGVSWSIVKNKPQYTALRKHRGAFF